MNDQAPNSDFHELTPDTILTLVERVVGTRCSNICRPLSSYINRVYEVHLEDGSAVVAKFYRPGRWNEEALRDEHDFVLDLEEAQIPVVAPLEDDEGETLFRSNQMYYAVYPRMGGRAFEDPNPDTWRELGRLLGRVHSVGAEYQAPSRPRMHPNEVFQENMDYILDSGAIEDESLSEHYEDVCNAILDEIDPLFDHVETIRIHGDCHAGNILFRPDERFHLIDFDDMAMGPPVQDLWMLLPGYADEVRVEFNQFLEGYQSFRELDPISFKLIEPLRAMRYIHFAAWCVRQRNDKGYHRLADDFGTDAYWRKELNDLNRQLDRIQIGL